jgi:hypothetical protein
MKALFISFFLLSTSVLAAEPIDTLHLIDGQAQAGIITSASTGSVTLSKEREQIVFKKSAVTRYVFSSADKVLLSGGDTLTCKILNEQGDTLAIITSTGPRLLSKGEFASIFFNTGARLVATELPQTGQAFRPQQAPSGPTTGTKLYLRAGYGFHSGMLDQWEQAWGNQEAPTSGPVVPLEAGVTLGTHWLIGGGYERFQTKTLEGSNAYGTFVGDLAYDFIFVALRWESSPLPGSWLRFYGGGDFGSVVVTEIIQTADGQRTITPKDPTSATVGLRLKAGATASLTHWMGVFVEGRFLLAKADPVHGTRADLEIGGPGALLGVEFHFAL